MDFKPAPAGEDLQSKGRHDDSGNHQPARDDDREHHEKQGVHQIVQARDVKQVAEKLFGDAHSPIPMQDHVQTRVAVAANVNHS